jgi:hypothetical protein
MSADEEDVIAGKLAREYAGLGKELLALLAKTDAYGDGYRKIASYLHSHNSQQGGGLRFGTKSDVLERIPNYERVVESCTRVLEIIERRKVVHASLKTMGLEPKEPPALLSPP